MVTTFEDRLARYDVELVVCFRLACEVVGTKLHWRGTAVRDACAARREPFTSHAVHSSSYGVRERSITTTGYTRTSLEAKAALMVSSRRCWMEMHRKGSSAHGRARDALVVASKARLHLKLQCACSFP